ncbi:hypothetical protein DAPPUDRAFT_236098 [Daphnia pulex]|uniref:Uncharacterized protein n=1 Tax=Daphnia pulex TaxID=6669 RepID=E9FZY7_DAPPU|nr:hypothetical protein DAPPUDRAFT_236098 [Daphnia pulex]|eukprot:EFX87175.1 hypothetical protein DAPPUDRAFT_236098 [Daphnia pulex]
MKLKWKMSNKSSMIMETYYLMRDEEEYNLGMKLYFGTLACLRQGRKASRGTD